MLLMGISLVSIVVWGVVFGMVALLLEQSMRFPSIALPVKLAEPSQTILCTIFADRYLED